MFLAVKALASLALHQATRDVFTERGYLDSRVISRFMAIQFPQVVGAFFSLLKNLAEHPELFALLLSEQVLQGIVEHVAKASDPEVLTQAAVLLYEIVRSEQGFQALQADEPCRDALFL